MYVGRFAPSPTGLLHQGSLTCALAAFLDARSHDGRFLIRIEDTDSFRSQVQYIEPILKTLTACEIVSDAPVLIQSERTDIYNDYLQKLLEAGLAYGCDCTAQRILAFNREHGILGRRYTGFCRNRHVAHPRSYRFVAKDESITFEDRLQGLVTQNVFADAGDFVLKRADGPFAYVFACAIDDALSGVTDVVRGIDILHMTTAQMAVLKALSFEVPRYLHIPLVTDTKGEKLSKQNRAQPVIDNYLAHLEEAFVFLGFERIGADTISAFMARAIEFWKNRYRK